MTSYHHGPSAPRNEITRRDARTTPAVGRPRQAGHAVPAAPGTTPGSDFQTYAAILRRNWPIIVASLVLVTFGVAAGDALKDPIYRASGTIEIRKQSAEVVPVEALFQFERISDQYLQTQYALLRSPTLVRRTLADSGLAAGFARAEFGRVDTTDGRQQLDSLAERARNRLFVDPVSGSRIVKVSFETKDPVIAATFVNAVIAEYIEMRQESGSSALDRFAAQAETIRTEMLQMEAQLQQFVRANGLGVITTSSGAVDDVNHERLRRLQDELTAAETEGIRAEALFGTARRQVDAAVDSDLLRTLRASIAQVQGEYAQVRATFTDSYPRARQLREQLADLNAQVEREQRRLRSTLGGQQQTAQSRRELLLRAVNDQRALMDDLSAKYAEYERRKRDLDVQKQLYGTIQQKRKEATVSASLAAIDIGVLDPAATPGSPISPLPKRDIPLGALVGVMLGLGVAFVRSYSDTTVRTLDEVEALSDRPVLALIPSVRTPVGPPVSHGGSAGALTSGTGQVFDDLAEAFRGLRTSVLFESMGPLPRVLMITSAAPGEGKTFVTTNLAISLASLGRRVLLIDADLRRPAVDRVFGLKGGAGLARCLAGDVTWEDALSRNVVPGLDVLSSCTDSLSPSDLLSSPAIGVLLREATAEYDFVLVDAPALFINVPDARILAQKVDGVVLVVRSGVTPRDLVRRLTAQTPNLVGLVLNGYDLRQLPASYAAYGERVATV
ncbi:MAG TPA: polysaccharide biosynthesis tyrosine autokinase [Gemmatimonadaceae bacterium]|nr:polysaccharide biosynthesis tyrosine autokinase [Gemmatimonadaceae bacterium]